MYLGATRKICGSTWFPPCTVQKHDVINIIRSQIVERNHAMEAVRQLLAMPGLQEITLNLEDDIDRIHLRKHFQLYINIYRRDCPFEVVATDRYNHTYIDASVVARCDIKAGEEVKYLLGFNVAIDEDQENILALTESDFSLIVSNRKKMCSLLLGPARFANHDCNANAKLMATGYSGVKIVAIRSIVKGEEVTVSYGGDYFGVGNEECLCHTCKLNCSNTKDNEGPSRTSHNTRITRSKSRCNVNANNRSIDPFGCNECAIQQRRLTHAQCPRCILHVNLYSKPWPDRD